ncbi:hypothetical protein L6164_032465 [Bauhinia variegata]|uniref:Uncharacterized protein n=1 Tax=Bauhinia variegata TaxID=167791 RepID=A0ACB9KNS2_BAUVA|nr:hypothetical protein L6164_032465 [Bauhinia variegata]
MSDTFAFQQHADADVTYLECKRNHAAALGFTTVDGCQEFLPAGGDGTRDAVICDACGCHRNFHRRVKVCNNGTTIPISPDTPIIALSPTPPPPIGSPVRMMNYGRNNIGAFAQAAPPQPNSRGTRIGTVPQTRRVFTVEQKAQLMSFARKVEWQIRNATDEDVNSICNDLGITRQVLRGWLNNNRRRLMTS